MNNYLPPLSSAHLQEAALRQSSYVSAQRYGFGQLGGLAGTPSGFFSRSLELSTEQKMQIELDSWLIDWDKNPEGETE